MEYRNNKIILTQNEYDCFVFAKEEEDIIEIIPEIRTIKEKKDVSNIKVKRKSKAKKLWEARNNKHQEIL